MQNTQATMFDFDPNRVFDAFLHKMELKNDAALSRLLEVPPPVISKVRHRRTPISAAILIRMHEVSGMTVRELRNIMGDRRAKFRVSNAQGRPEYMAEPIHNGTLTARLWPAAARLRLPQAGAVGRRGR
jgi:plasmid maintenance system antidote protein VapI